MSTYLLQILAVVFLPLVVPFCQRQFIKLRNYRTVKPRSYNRREGRRNFFLIGITFIYFVLIARNILASESNVYKLTNSRLKAPIDVLQKRLIKLGQTRSQVLWQALQSSPELVLQYQRLGDDSLLRCSWCSLEAPQSYLYFMIGRIALSYLGHVALLSLVTDSRILVVASTAFVFSVETYLRAGALDELNAKSESVEDIWFVDSYAPLVRQCLFLLSALVVRISIYLSARFPSPQADLLTIKKEIVEAIEKVRVSNSMQRTVYDNGMLRAHMNEFWSRNEEMTKKIYGNDELISARANAATRLPHLQDEKIAASERIERVISGSLPP